MRALSDLYAALADETRLQMLALLLENDELCVCDLVFALQITQSKASRHLRILRNAGLLEDRREALWVHYRLAPGMDASRRAILSGFKEAVASQDLDHPRRRLRAWLRSRAKDAACAGGPRRTSTATR
jgi:ArsR family transcriptional regulator